MLKIGEFPRFPTEFCVTHNCVPQSLRRLKENGEIHTGNTEEFDPLPIYQVVELSKPDNFTSCAARVGLDTENAFLRPYGEIILVLKPRSIAAETFIFNGDMKDIAVNARRLFTTLDKAVRVYRLDNDDPEALAEMLRRLPQSYKKELPCIFGNYLEARLMRSLTIADVEDIWVPANCSEGVKADATAIVEMASRTNLSSHRTTQGIVEEPTLPDEDEEAGEAEVAEPVQQEDRIRDLTHKALFRRF